MKELRNVYTVSNRVTGDIRSSDFGLNIKDKLLRRYGVERGVRNFRRNEFRVLIMANHLSSQKQLLESSRNVRTLSIMEDQIDSYMDTNLRFHSTTSPSTSPLFTSYILSYFYSIPFSYHFNT